jgi:hypothetical protein
MEQITIRIKDKKKARSLVDFLKTLDFVEKVSSSNVTDLEDTQKAPEEDFFAHAGLWSERDISLQSIREKAWPYRT